MLQRISLLVLLAAALLGGCNKSRTAYALTEDGTSILRFDIEKPKTIDATVTVSGLIAGETLWQIDFRRADGALYGITSGNRLVRVDPGTGTCTYVGAPDATTGFTTPFTSATLARPVMDVDPVSGDLRVIDTASPSAEHNIELNPDDATGSDNTTALTYGTNDVNAGNGTSPNLVAIAHDNNVSSPDTTTLYGLDISTYSLVSLTSNTVTTVGKTGYTFTQSAGFDIVPNDNKAYVILSKPSGTARVLTISLSGGAVDDRDQLGDGSYQIRSLAVSLNEPKDFSKN